MPHVQFPEVPDSHNDEDDARHPCCNVPLLDLKVEACKAPGWLGGLCDGNERRHEWNLRAHVALTGSTK